MFNSNASATAAEDASKYIENVFSTYIYTGTGASQSIVNNIDESGKGAMTWIKQRSSTQNNLLFDTTRGATQRLFSNLTNGQDPDAASLTAFNSNGFSIGADSGVNGLNETYVSRTFREQEKFFDVVTYTGTGSARTIAHSLGSTPGCMIVKKTSNTDAWLVYHRSLGATGYTLLNTTAAFATGSTVWNNTDPTSTDFTVGASYSTNQPGETYVAYIFAHNAGGFGLTGTDNVISCGGWTAASPPAGGFVDLGYEPQWIMFRRADTIDNWWMYDNMRGWPATGTADRANRLYANTSGAESGSGSDTPQITSTGFYVNSDWTANDFIYIAIRRGPMKVPTDATKVYAVTGITNATAPWWTSGFPVDFAFYSTTGVSDKASSSRLTDGNSLVFNTSDAQFASSAYTFNYQNGWYNNTGASSGSYYSWMFGRAPGFMDVVCYTGTGTSGQTFSHNLQAVPELMILKRRDTTAGWPTYSSALGATKFLVVNTDSVVQTSSAFWNNTSPTSSVFSVGNSTSVNASGGTYAAYLFATCAGISKVGSYTGTAATQQISCGFAAGARFVLIKRTDSAGDWYLYDSARGIVAGNDPYLLLNSTAAQVTGTDYVDTYAAGFELTSTAPAALNANGGSYIFLAIA
jgi:hypothetical protein